MHARILAVGLLATALLPAVLLAQSANEVPLERCDRLPIVKVHIGSTEMRFLVDTGATTMLNLKSFSGGNAKGIQITSWSGTAFTSAREVSIPDLALGDHHLRNLNLPAIDLSPVGDACGGHVDGILGVDLLDEMGITIDSNIGSHCLGTIRKWYSRTWKPPCNPASPRSMRAKRQSSRTVLSRKL